eukprot:m.62868 g.62868  ORF g.62868 m.62868 type:complete len:123 (+) comp49602_c0_seq3:748-1116(+)
MFPLVRFLPNFVFRNKFDNISKIRKVRVPTLLLSGETDEMIPPTMMDALSDACRAPIVLIERFPGGRHNTTWQCELYEEAIERFLDHVIRYGPFRYEPTEGSDSLLTNAIEVLSDVPTSQLI